MRGRRRGNEREVTQESTFSDEVTNLNFELVSLCFPPRWPDTLFQFGFFFNIRIKQSAMTQKKTLSRVSPFIWRQFMSTQWQQLVVATVNISIGFYGCPAAAWPTQVWLYRQQFWNWRLFQQRESQLRVQCHTQSLLTLLLLAGDTFSTCFLDLRCLFPPSHFSIAFHHFPPQERRQSETEESL